MPQRKPLEKFICENNMPQKYIFPLKLTNYKHFSEASFIFWMKGKTDLETCNNRDQKSHENFFLKLGG